MARRINLLRLDYLFSVIVPLLIAIYLNNLTPLKYIDILFGFGLLAITGNTWNDMIDMKDPEEKETMRRVEGYHPREIFTIGLGSLIFGIALLLRTCLENYINAIFLGIVVIMVITYCLWIKPIPIINQIFLATSHVILPYFMIKVDAGIFSIEFGELIFLIAFFTFAVLGQIVHEVIDNDAIRKHLSLRQCQIVIWIFSILTLILAGWAFVLIQDYYFLPFLFVPLGTIFTFRRPTESTQGVKDVGILIGNFLMFYFIALIIMNFI
ncbi:MAG: hypothetical protein GF311_06635 [Candidatus Lokiarchaeota archaeon]|nr:hypothetical protein [Candidatus Lokiarchaeota archaeon]